MQLFFLRENDDDSVFSDSGGANDYAAQDYKFFDCVWHWMDPATIIYKKIPNPFHLHSLTTTPFSQHPTLWNPHLKYKTYRKKNLNFKF